MTEWFLAELQSEAAQYPAVGAQGLQNRGHLVREDRDIARDHEILIRAREGGPRIQPHPRVAQRAMHDRPARYRPARSMTT
jgi:hypothetical protein